MKQNKKKRMKQNEKICYKFMFCPKKMFCSIQVVNSSCMIQRTRIFQHTYKKNVNVPHKKISNEPSIGVSQKNADHFGCPKMINYDLRWSIVVIKIITC